MNQHFRTAVLTIILAGGTLTSYATAYAMMGRTPAAVVAVEPVRAPAAIAKRLPVGQTDVSVREACSTFEGTGARNRCMQDIAGAPRPVRIIDFATLDGTTLIR